MSENPNENPSGEGSRLWSGLEARLRARLAGLVENVEFHESVTTTQRRAHQLAHEGLLRAVVAAGEQTEGRGRAARRWESPKGCGLYFSVLFRPALPPSSAYLTNVAAALAVAKAVKSLLEVELSLKWPNDLLLSSGLKVCGILSESAIQGGTLDYCVTGVGLNLREPSEPLPPEVARRAGWLCSETESAKLDGAKLIACVVENFFGGVALIEREGAGPLLGEYREKCVTVGKTVTVEAGSETFSGLCVGIGGDGELLLETDAGQRCFHAADVLHTKGGASFTHTQAESVGPVPWYNTNGF
ncbi:MAG: biotin--[acetyl-CoA-carboxylase] ligase [Synergistaceae bacterium]|nr:biotin--[acetyl-CoA-carboxylase] ligase [Synergistaceae bacterium]